MSPNKPSLVEIRLLGAARHIRKIYAFGILDRSNSLIFTLDCSNDAALPMKCLQLNLYIDFHSSYSCISDVFVTALYILYNYSVRTSSPLTTGLRTGISTYIRDPARMKLLDLHMVKTAVYSIYQQSRLCNFFISRGVMWSTLRNAMVFHYHASDSSEFVSRTHAACVYLWSWNLPKAHFSLYYGV